MVELANEIPQLGQRLGLRICFSAGELQDAVVGAGGKAETVHRLLQQHLPCSINLAIFTHHSAAHLRIREQPVTTLETLFLDFPRRHHPLSDVGRERYFDSTIYLPVTLSWNPNFIVQTVHIVRGRDNEYCKHFLSGMKKMYFCKK